LDKHKPAGPTLYQVNAGPAARKKYLELGNSRQGLGNWEVVGLDGMVVQIQDGLQNRRMQYKAKWKGKR